LRNFSQEELKLLYLSGLLLVLGVILLVFANRRIEKVGFNEGQILSWDSPVGELITEVLCDESIGLAGKPDYIIKQKKMVLPVEVKSSKFKNNPYASHIYQLAAYCRLIDKNYNIRPKFGVLQYTNQTVHIEYTKNLENRLLTLINKMQNQAKQLQLDRSHRSRNRCNNCGYSSFCDQRLK
jgi:CRISPR-associated exonuclease Cas4